MLVRTLVFLDTPLHINRQTGVVTFSQPLTNYVAKTGDVMSGKLNMNSVGGSVATNTSAIQIDDANEALMAFHRPGTFATLIGLNALNQFVIGGWSMPVGHFVFDVGYFYTGVRAVHGGGTFHTADSTMG